MRTVTLQLHESWCSVSLFPVYVHWTDLESRLNHYFSSFLESQRATYCYQNTYSKTGEESADLEHLDCCRPLEQIRIRWVVYRQRTHHTPCRAPPSRDKNAPNWMLRLRPAASQSHIMKRDPTAPPALKTPFAVAMTLVVVEA